MTDTLLTPDHLAMLHEGSGIALDVITERGYRKPRHDILVTSGNLS